MAHPSFEDVKASIRPLDEVPVNESFWSRLAYNLGAATYFRPTYGSGPRFRSLDDDSTPGVSNFVRIVPAMVLGGCITFYAIVRFFPHVVLRRRAALEPTPPAQPPVVDSSEEEEGEEGEEEDQPPALSTPDEENQILESGQSVVMSPSRRQEIQKSAAEKAKKSAGASSGETEEVQKAAKKVSKGQENPSKK